MSRTGVVVEGGVVRNYVVWSDESEAQFEAEGWDYAIETTGMIPQPGMGWLYDETNGFRPPQPHPSWVWSNKASSWQAPTAMPIDGGQYEWNETTQTWDAIPAEEPAPNP